MSFKVASGADVSTLDIELFETDMRHLVWCWWRDRVLMENFERRRNSKMKNIYDRFLRH